MSDHKPIDVLKICLQTMVLVSGAVGSAMNLLRGNGVPLALALLAVAVILVVIISEIRSQRKGVPAAAAVPHSIPVVPPRPVAYARPTPPQATQPAWGLDDRGRPVIRVVRLASRSAEERSAP